MALPLHTHAKVRGLAGRPYKVLGLEQALGTPLRRETILVRLSGLREEAAAPALIRNGFAGIYCDKEALDAPGIYAPGDPAVIGEGDALRVNSQNGAVRILFRRHANANMLFITERCNSRCLMCSQPPREENDDWRIDELKALIPLIDPDLPHLGITGGEPTLLGDKLAWVLSHCAQFLPATQLHILTNGRLFAERSLALRFQAFRDRVTWAVPIYSDIPDSHDHIVQASGGFAEAIEGIYNLAELGFPIEIRVVLHKLSVPRLQELTDYLCRNFPFCAHIAFMGLEPIGFAKRNMDVLWIDPVDYAAELEAAVLSAHARRMKVSIYNIPHCLLGVKARIFARRSISDWKNIFPSQCAGCSAKSDCSGFFASAGVAWLSRGLAPIH